MSYVRAARQTYHATEDEQVEVEKRGQWRVLDEAKKRRVLFKGLVLDARVRGEEDSHFSRE